jgi:hypothetical protein
MITISRQEADNISGIVEVLFIDVNDMVLLPEQVGHIIDESQIILRTGINWLNLYGTPESIALTFDAENTPAGTIYNTRLALRYPRENTTIIAAMEDMARRAMLIAVTDGNNLKKLLGDVKNPMRMLFAPVKPGEASGYNGYELIFEGRYTHTPYILA